VAKDRTENRLRSAPRIPAPAWQLPILRSLLPFGHDVAANQRLLFGAAGRIFWLKITTTVVLCTGLAMSPHLWVGPRTYPVAPLWNLLPESVHAFELVLFIATFALAAAILVAAKPQKLIAALLGILVVFCVLDQTRWQPWVFQYGFLLAALALFSWDGNDEAGQKRTLNIARLIIATTYIFSGLQKLNLNFINNEFPWLVEPITNVMPSAHFPLYVLGMAAPFIQVGFGIGLLTKKFRKISLILAVSMHVFVLAMFGPLGHNWNHIVWPWTAAMAVFDVLLFTGKHDFSAEDIFRTRRHPYHACVLVLFAILPVLSFFNLWDSYLSSALYAGNLTEATIYANDVAKNSLPASISARLIHTSPDTNVLNIQRWAIEDLTVTPYPETRVYKQIAKAVCEQTRYPAGIVLLVREQRMFGSKPETGYRCWEL